MGGVASLMCILFGVVSFVTTDVQVNTIGLGWCSVNVVCTLASRVMERALLVDESMNLGFAAMNLMNNLLGLVPATALWLFSTEATPHISGSISDLSALSDELIALIIGRWFDV